MRYGVSATVVRADEPNAFPTTEGLSPGTTVVLRTDGSLATSGFFVVTFQPRTSTSSAPSAPVSTARSTSRLSPRTSSTGLPPEAGSGFTNSSSPWSSSRTRAPLSAASCRRNSQSETLAWVSCLCVIGGASTRPQARPAPAATRRTMSAVRMSRNARTLRPRWSRCAFEDARITVNVPVESLSSSTAVTSPVNSRSRARSSTVTTETFSGVPRVMPVAVSSS